MIGKLCGVIVAEDPPFLTVDVGGVGYEVACPVGMTERARMPDGKVNFWIHTVVRADALELFAFASELERRIFRQLILVPNVGPRTALGVLSALPATDLVEAVQAADLARLVRVPGVGKKTAERLVLELRGKLPSDEIQHNAKGPSPAAPPLGDVKSRLVAALTNMGYRQVEAERAVQALGPRVGSEPLSTLLREALVQLSS
jgi:Holliday junction DNA helicase RuvA